MAPDQIMAMGLADRAGAGWPQVREDVAEEVGGNHHIEALGAEHEARGENVDVVFVPANVGVLTGHRLKALVPVGHADGDAV